MAKFELIEYSFDSGDYQLTMEDDFLLARIGAELDKATDPDQLREGAKKLLQLAVHRQAVIRSLVRRLADLESGAIRKLYTE